jgi:hypothetical protein
MWEVSMGGSHTIIHQRKSMLKYDLIHHNVSADIFDYVTAEDSPE